MKEKPKIWLPDDKQSIQVDTGTAPDVECTVYQMRVTMTLQALKPPSGFDKGKP